MSSKLAKAALVLVLGLGAAFWYWSPLLTLYQLQAAAKAGDADAFNDNVDYPRLRESVKSQLSDAFAQQVANRKAEDTDSAKAGVAFGSMLGLVMVDKLVDGFVRPEVVMRVVKSGKLVPHGKIWTTKPKPSTASEAPLQWATEHRGVDKFIVHLWKDGETSEQRMDVVLERTGFVAWKLTEVRLAGILSQVQPQ
jgi:hypothetical protein